jgi:hypothetical protein
MKNNATIAIGVMAECRTTYFAAIPGCSINA